MALIATMKLRDSHARVTTKRLEHFNEVLTDAQTNMAILAPLLALITDLQLVAVTYSLADESDAFAGAAASNIDVGATFRLALTGGGEAAFKVPGFPDAKVTAGSDAIPVDDADVVAFFNTFLAGGPWRVSDGQSITSIVKGTLDK